MRSSERATRSIAKIQNPNTFDLPTRKRKILTTEELKERRKKREENAEKKARLKEEKEQMKEEARKKRIETLWKENNYNSLNITLSEDEDDSEEELNEEDEEQLAIQYVKGDVTQPVKTKGNPAIIVHCVDDSGYWGKGGLFTAIAHRSSSAVHAYELAGAMEDLHLGHAHLTPFTENEENVNAQNFLSLIVAQSRDKYHRLLPMNLSSLSEGLQRVYKAAKKLNATVHLPRIGHSTPGFNWYGTERLIRKHLASRGVYTLIYYFPRKVTAATKMGHSSREDSSEKNEKPSKTYRHVSERSQMSSEPSTSRMLPDFFSGVCIYFKDVPGEKEKKLRRYVIAYNGDVTSILCNDVTHIVCDVKRPPSSDKHGEEVKFVNSKWVEDCVKKQQLLNTARYLVE